MSVGKIDLNREGVGTLAVFRHAVSADKAKPLSAREESIVLLGGTRYCAHALEEYFNHVPASCLRELNVFRWPGEHDGLVYLHCYDHGVVPLDKSTTDTRDPRGRNPG